MPKILGTNLVEHREQTRDRLFKALSELLEEHGFSSLTLAEIAARAKVGRTAVYNHFPDKEALLLAFIANETATYSRRLNKALTNIDDPLEKLRVYVAEQVHLKTSYHLAPDPDFMEIMSKSSAADMHAHAAIIEGVLAEILRDGINQGVFPPQDIRATIPLVHATLSGWNVPKRGEAQERFIKAAQDFILRAVGVNIPTPAATDGEIIASARVGSGACPVQHHTPTQARCPIKH